MKKKLVISCPASSRSGYGDHSRDLIRSLIDIGEYDITIMDQRWGDCPQDALKKEDLDISSRIALSHNQLQNQPDVWIQVTVPNEFQPLGKFNIGITAGMETTLVSPEWVEGMNRMDLNIVPSLHSKNAFLHSTYDKVDKASNKKIATLKVEKPIEILFEGLDVKKYYKTKDVEPKVKEFFGKVKEEFCFLSCGHWLKGDFGHDRKDIGSLIKNFVLTFKGIGKAKRPALVLKTSSATFSVQDREEVLRKINVILKNISVKKSDLPTIYLLHGDLTDKEMNSLYNHPKIKAMVSFTHGEGFGRPLMEFSNTGKPTIASNWSGHVDFLSEHGLMLAGSIETVHKSAVWDKVILPESKWFYVDQNYASVALKSVFKDYKKYLEKSRKQTQYIKENFTLEIMTERFKEIMKAADKVPTKVALKLPKLEKTNV